MNLKRIALLSVGVLVTIFITDFIIHGVLLKSMYQSMPSLWRPEMDMPAYMPFMMLGQVVLSVFFAVIFLHGYKGTGAMEGVRFGAFIGGFMAGTNLVMYAVVPYTMELVLAWIVLGTIQMALAGVVCTLIADRVK